MNEDCGPTEGALDPQNNSAIKGGMGRKDGSAGRLRRGGLALSGV